MKNGSQQTISRGNMQTLASTVCKKSPVNSSELKNKTIQRDFVQLFPLEVTLKIFSELDIRSLCSASMTCKSWNHTIENCDHLWKRHCLSVRAVCQREIDGDRGNGYSWKYMGGESQQHLERHMLLATELNQALGLQLSGLIPGELIALDGVLGIHPCYGGKQCLHYRFSYEAHAVTLLRNYWKSKVKHEWLSGKYSNIHSHSGLPEKSMYPMDADTWGEILEAELERKEAHIRLLYRRN